MKLGVTQGPYQKHTVEEATRLAAKAGFDGMQFNLAFAGIEMFKYNSYADLSALDEPLCRRIRSAFDSAGIEPFCQGVYTSLTVSDAETLRKHVDYFKTLIAHAPLMGTRVLVTEAGPRADGGFERCVGAFRELVEAAEEHDVRLAVEPSYRQAVPCSEKALRLIELVGGDRLGVMIDPANILVYDSLENAFDVLRGHIIYGHAKDCRIDEKGAPTFPAAGQGQLDYHRYIELLLEHGIETLIIEYVTEETVGPVSEWLRGVIADVEG